MQAYFWQANDKYFFANIGFSKQRKVGKRIEIATKGVVDRREEGGGEGAGKEKYPPPLSHFIEIKDDGSANYR